MSAAAAAAAATAVKIIGPSRLYMHTAQCKCTCVYTDSRCLQVVTWAVAIDIHYPDTVLPIHIAWHDEATAKSTTKYGRR